MEKISSKQIKSVILEHAKGLKRKKQIFEEVQKLEAELKAINESITTGSYGFVADGDKSAETKTGFKSPQAISNITQLAEELNEDMEEVEETKKTPKI